MVANDSSACAEDDFMGDFGTRRFVGELLVHPSLRRSAMVKRRAAGEDFGNNGDRESKSPGVEAARSSAASARKTKHLRSQIKRAGAARSRKAAHHAWVKR